MSSVIRWHSPYLTPILPASSGSPTRKQYTNYELAIESNRHLSDYLPYLKDLQEKAGSWDKLDLDRFESDIKNGLYFESNIPQGYGIGSSGALVAAIYDQYLINPNKNRKILTGMEISNLKEIFSRMESYFHGVSSGLDPLLMLYPSSAADQKQAAD